MKGALLKRRTLIVLGAGAGGAVALTAMGYGPRWMVNSLIHEAAQRADLYEMLKTQPWSAVIGKRYLESQGADAPKIFVMKALLARDLIATGADNAVDRAQMAIENDFANDHTCEVDGWTLSVTECRLGALVYLAMLEFGSAGQTSAAQFPVLENWGPRRTIAGMPFNEQPNGNSSIWMSFANLEHNRYLVRMGDLDMITTAQPNRNIITADLTPEQAMAATSKSRELPVYLVDQTTGSAQLLGIFAVNGKLNQVEQNYYDQRLRILAWGPKETTVGTGFNLQPDGSSAFWLMTDRSHRTFGNYQLVLGTIEMATTVNEDNITAILPPDATAELVANPTRMYLLLRDHDKNTDHSIGAFTVTPEPQPEPIADQDDL